MGVDLVQPGEASVSREEERQVVRRPPLRGSLQPPLRGSGSADFGRYALRLIVCVGRSVQGCSLLAGDLPVRSDLADLLTHSVLRDVTGLRRGISGDRTAALRAPSSCEHLVSTSTPN
jgi:hypothetical protein